MKLGSTSHRVHSRISFYCTASNWANWDRSNNDIDDYNNDTDDINEMGMMTMTMMITKGK